MTNKLPFGISLAIFLATLASAAFVHLHGLLQANLLQYGYKMNMSVLPMPTTLFYRYSTAGYLLPGIVLLSMVLYRKGRQRSIVRQETLMVVVGLMSVVWLLACVLAWQMPAYTPVAFIK